MLSLGGGESQKERSVLGFDLIGAILGEPSTLAGEGELQVAVPHRHIRTRAIIDLWFRVRGGVELVRFLTFRFRQRERR